MAGLVTRPTDVPSREPMSADPSPRRQVSLFEVASVVLHCNSTNACKLLRSWQVPCWLLLAVRHSCCDMHPALHANSRCPHVASRCATSPAKTLMRASIPCPCHTIHVCSNEADVESGQVTPRTASSDKPASHPVGGGGRDRTLSDERSAKPQQTGSSGGGVRDTPPPAEQSGFMQVKLAGGGILHAS